MDNRLRTVLPSIISQDQTGFLAGRNISVNIRKSLDVMEFCKNQNIPALIMSIDMEKCFDRITYPAIYGSLRYFNFGEAFIQWVSLFFTEFKVCTQNYGHLSDFFTKTRSVNQGCNISPSIYLLAGEVLALKLKNHPGIRGIRIGTTELLLSQFADDMDLYLPYDKTVLDNVMGVLADVEKSIGLKVSYEKSTLYRIGSIRNSNARFYTKKAINWSNESINTLGVDLHHEDICKNYEKIIQKMRATAHTWWYRKVSLTGKVLLVNTLLGSLFVYKMQVLPQIPEKMVQQIEEEIKSFLWSGKRAKLSLSILKCSKNNGGLGLVDLRAKQISLMLRWVKLYFENSTICNIANQFLGAKAKEHDIWSCNLTEEDAQVIIPTNSYWRQVYQCWCKQTYTQPQNRQNILLQPLWWNSNIKINNKPMYNVKAIRAKMTRIQDIYDEGVNRFFHL